MLTIEPDEYSSSRCSAAQGVPRAQPRPLGGEEGWLAHGVAFNIGAAKHKYILSKLINIYADCLAAANAPTTQQLQAIKIVLEGEWFRLQRCTRQLRTIRLGCG
jgi:hypothetical protein